MVMSLIPVVSARPRSAEYTIGIYFETAKNIKAFESSSLDSSIPYENLAQLETFILCVIGCRCMCRALTNR